MLRLNLKEYPRHALMKKVKSRFNKIKQRRKLRNNQNFESFFRELQFCVMYAFFAL